MTTVSIRLPHDLKERAFHLAKKKNMSFNSLVNYWLQTAVTQEETLDWMTRRLHGKAQRFLIAEFGRFLTRTSPGDEPSLDEINQAMNE